ncbi:MAG: GNAT family N-acetyltransferase [Gammaproteobacteria bacterium]|nr:GNAT family N-acetyltransferase [Gammaproteobacteria bacterium]
MDNIEFRSIEKDELDSFNKVVKYVFAESSTDPVPEEDELKPEWTTAAFHKGKIVATSGGFPFEMRFNGKPIAVDGLTAVGTEPGFRRRGLVREMVTRRLHAVHEHEEQSASILWASMGAIYQRFGYGLGSSQIQCKFDPRFTQFQFPGDVNGYVRIVSEEEGGQVIRDLYSRFVEDRTLDLHRDDDVWWKGYFGTKKRLSYIAIYFNANDEPEGYVAYKTSTFSQSPDEGPDQKLWVRELIYLNIQAYRALWEFIREHDLVAKVEMQMALDEPAINMLLEPRAMRLNVLDGIWMRIVDAEKALTQREYSGPGNVVLEIQNDSECPWNERRFELETDGETTEVAETNKSPQLTISPNGLASLMTGNASLSELNRVGRADVSDTKKMRYFDFMFSTKYRPFCRNGF